MPVFGWRIVQFFSVSLMHRFCRMKLLHLYLLAQEFAKWAFIVKENHRQNLLDRPCSFGNIRRSAILWPKFNKNTLAWYQNEMPKVPSPVTNIIKHLFAIAW